MKQSITPDARVRRISISISIIGAAAAVIVYVCNASETADSSELRPDDSKVYLREVEKYGGQGELLMRDLNDEFASFWHGRRLAFTILILTAAGVWTYRFFALPLPPVDNEQQATDNQ